MKRNTRFTLMTSVFVLAVLLSMGGSAGASPAKRPLLQGGAPTVVSYQGQVTVDGSAYTGTGYFKFAVVDQAGTTTAWSNDGTSTAGSEPTAAVTLTVTNGLFNVLLGDTALTNMTALPASAFNSTDRLLRVWFSNDGTTFTLLIPDRRIAAVPYALQAEEAKSAATAGDANTLDGQDSAAFQARVSGECAAGSTVRLINADGSVVCEPRATRPGLSLATLDSAGSVGWFTSMTIGTDGLGLISYYDSTNSDLKVAHCNDPACATATTTTLDSAGNVGWLTSVTIGADGLGLISYRDITNAALKVAHCSNTACTAATLTTLDPVGGLFGVLYTSVAIGADGLGLISYYDFSNANLKVAHCSNITCTTATLTTLDTGNVGDYTSVAIGADGLGLISYRDNTNANLKVAHCSNANCTTATLTTLDSAGNVGGHSAVTIGADGLGLISYADDTNHSLKAAHCSNLTCTTATLATLDSGTTANALYTSVTIGADGLGLISYSDYATSSLKVAHCTDLTCTAATNFTLDSVGDVGLYTSVTIGADGLGLISYGDNTNGNLKVAHCSSTLCSPYIRRR